MDSAPRKVRADAQRNRDHLVAVARHAFSAGADGVSLEAIAREAGVGIGTLYRHFPTRESLVEAVYRTELADVCDSAAELLREHDPEEALRLWMDVYAGFVATKRGMAETLRSVLSSGAIASSETRQRITHAIQTILDTGAAAGSLRDDVHAEDVAASLVGVFLATPDPAQSEQAQRMLDLLFAGITSRDR
jgi:Transcriptional regulator